MLKIGDVELKNPVVLAPMAGVCNSAFRLTVKEFGVGLVCAEMVCRNLLPHLGASHLAAFKSRSLNGVWLEGAFAACPCEYIRDGPIVENHVREAIQCSF